MKHFLGKIVAFGVMAAVAVSAWWWTSDRDDNGPAVAKNPEAAAVAEPGAEAGTASVLASESGSSEIEESGYAEPVPQFEPDVGNPILPASGEHPLVGEFPPRSGDFDATPIRSFEPVSRGGISPQEPPPVEGPPGFDATPTAAGEAVVDSPIVPPSFEPAAEPAVETAVPPPPAVDPVFGPTRKRRVIRFNEPLPPLTLDSLPPNTATSTPTGSEISLPRTIGGPQPGDASPASHVVQPGESYWTISRKHYGTARFFQALAAYNKNRIPDPRRMRPGMKVWVPTRKLLESRFAKLLPGSPPAGTVTPVGFFIDADGHPMYQVTAEDTLVEISLRYLGRQSRWIQIYQLNRTALPSPHKLKLGTILRLPADAVRVKLVPRTAAGR